MNAQKEVKLQFPLSTTLNSTGHANPKPPLRWVAEIANQFLYFHPIYISITGHMLPMQ